MDLEEVGVALREYYIGVGVYYPNGPTEIAMVLRSLVANPEMLNSVFAHGWLPFDTRPKRPLDGEPMVAFLIWIPASEGEEAHAEIMESHSNIEIIGGTRFWFELDPNPTHWRPLLLGPSGSK